MSQPQPVVGCIEFGPRPNITCAACPLFVSTCPKCTEDLSAVGRCLEDNTMRSSESRCAHV